MTTKDDKKRLINSRRKGADAERELAKKLTELGFPAERGQQKRGGADSPDVICESLGWLHWEVKLVSTCRILSPAQVAEWEAQATRDCGTKHRVIAHRWNGARQWWVQVWTSGQGPYWQTLYDFLANERQLRQEKASFILLNEA